MKKQKIFKVGQIVLVVIGLVLITSYAHAQLILESVSPADGPLGKDLELTLKGNGFDENTRCSMYLDIGNKRTIIGVADTPVSAQNVVVSGATAYVADHISGLQIIDISDPSNPFIIGSADTPGYALGVAVSGTTVYVADYENGLQIIDVTDPTNAVITGSVDTPDRAEDIMVSGTIAYVADGKSGLQIIDISDPKAPVIVSSVNTPGIAKGVTVSGATAYVADGNSNSLHIINVGNPSTPSIIKSFDTMGYAESVAISGTRLYLMVGLALSSGLQIIDVTDSGNPINIGSVDMPGYASEIIVSGMVAYVANKESGLSVIDVSNPGNPAITGFVDTPDSAMGITLSGTTAYVADRRSGLQIIDLSIPVKSAITGSVDTPDTAMNVSVSGTTAFVADFKSGVHVIDVNDSSNPTIVSTVDTPGDASGIAISGSTAFVADGSSGLQAIDVSNPASPFIVGAVDTPGSANNITISGTTAFIADGSTGLQIIDVSNPAAPFIIGAVDTPGDAKDVTVSGMTAFVADYGVQVIDVNDPANPFIVGAVNTPGSASGISISGTTVFIADGSKGLQVIDVIDPFNPVIIGVTDTPGNSRDVVVSGLTAYVADGSNGLHAIDVSDPANPLIIGTVDTTDYVRGLSITEDKAFVADRNNGLQILNVPRVITASPVVTSPTGLSLTVAGPQVPGYYTLRVFNKTKSDELPGAVNFHDISVVQIYFENFEGDTSWEVIEEPGANNTWEIGSATAKSGNKSAYISCDKGNTAAYNSDERESNLEVPVNLALYETATLNFWWRCKGEAEDNGEVYVYDGTYHLVSDPREFRDNSTWTQKVIDLTPYAGKSNIRIRFNWNNDWIMSDAPGFCIDDVEITGRPADGIVFTTHPDTRALPDSAYMHLITTNNTNGNDVEITAPTLPTWLFLTDPNPTTGTATLKGTPGLEDRGSHEVVLSATDGTSTATLSFTINVPFYFEDFESNVSEWPVIEEPGTINTWKIGEAVAKNGSKSVYISDDGGVTAGYDNNVRNESDLEFSVDLRYTENPSLSFFWQNEATDYCGYGEVWVEDEDGSLDIVSSRQEYVNNELWIHETIDLKPYEGKIIFIRFKWNNSYDCAGSDFGFCVDDVEVNGDLASGPVIKGPVFTTNPWDTDTTVSIGQTYTYAIDTRDADGDEVTISPILIPPWLSVTDINRAEGTAILSGTPEDKSDIGWHSLVVEASDGTNITEQSFDLYAFSEENFRFERMWPTLGQPWYFKRPKGVAVDKEGNFYVTDSYNHRVQKFNSNGQFITKWGNEGYGEGEFYVPYGIAVGPDGNVYVVDSYNCRIQKFTPTGEFITMWGSRGSEDGQFAYDGAENGGPRGIAVDSSGIVYVADTYNSRIQKFSPDGEFMAKWGEFGFTDGKFLFIQGLAVDGNGNVYVIDPLESVNHHVQKFTSDGQFIKKWGKSGSGSGEFAHPQGISVDEEGNVCVADAGNSRIQKFNPEGEFVGQWPTDAAGYGGDVSSNPNAIAMDGKGNIYVTDYSNDCIHKFNQDGTFITSWAAYGSGEGKFAMPAGVVTDDNGNVYIPDSQNDRIQIFGPDGRFMKTLGSSGPGDGQFNSPMGIAMDGTGNIYVSDCDNNRIQKLNPEGQFITSWGSHGSADKEFTGPMGIAIDRTRRHIYVVDAYNHRIQKFDLEGTFIAKWGRPGSGEGEFYLLYGIAVDNAGDVYVADAGNSRIQKFSSDGEFITEWGTVGDGNGELSVPCGVTVNEFGEIYVVDTGNSRIQRFTSDGQFLSKFGEFGSEPGQFNYPFWIDVNSTGRLYVSEISNNRVQVFRRFATVPDNKAIVLAGGVQGDKLWDEIQVNVNSAYRALLFQGFTEDQVYYLSSNSNLDEVDADATNSNLQDAIINWAKDCDNLVLYLVDHGGDASFRMNDTEILNADDLNSWLDTLQETMTGRVVIIYDACYAGSFLPALSPTDKNRIVITSTSASESAYFTSQGLNSFSNYFWTSIFNGRDIKEAFEQAQGSVYDAVSFQSPLIDSNQNGLANEIQDTDAVWNVYIGNGTPFHEDKTIIHDSGAVIDEASIDLYAEATYNDEISRVWAVIKPSDFDQELHGQTVLGFPSVDLTPVGGNRYEGTYKGFVQHDMYQIAFYVTDGKGNTSVPEIITVSAGSPLRDKVIFVAGASFSDEIWPAVANHITLAYDALYLQGYRNTEDFYLISPEVILPGINTFDNIPENLRLTLETWAGPNTRDVILYLVGNSSQGRYQINGTETLEPDDLNTWLNTLQNNISGKATIIFDALASGDYLEFLTVAPGKERIFMSSTSGGLSSSFLFKSDVSFSNFFWRNIMNGLNIRDAFWQARNTVKFLLPNQVPLLDDNGNGVGNDLSDGQLAMRCIIGMGIQLTVDKPTARIASPERTLYGETSAALWVEDVTSSSEITKVWAVITPPDNSSDLVTELPLDLTDNRYQGIYNDFSCFGYYQAAIYAMDAKGNVFNLKNTVIYQATGPDMYEEDDNFSEANPIVINSENPQHHNFYEPEDEDWIKFYGFKGETYKIKAGNLETNCNVAIKLYDPDDLTTPLEEMDDPNNPQADEVLEWTCTREGLYYVKTENKGTFGEHTGYELEATKLTAPLTGTIKGTVRDKITGELIKDVIITTDRSYSDISSADGLYFMMEHLPGDFVLRTGVQGYHDYEYTGYLEKREIRTIDIFLIPLDLPPVAVSPIPDLTVSEDAADSIIDLSDVFADGDNDDDLIIKSLQTETNRSLVWAAVDGNTLTLDYQDEAHGEATITILAVSNGKTTTDSFTLLVEEENDLPTLDEIFPLEINEDAGPQTILLTGIGTGAFNETQDLTVKAVSSDPGIIPNPSVSDVRTDATAILSFAPAEHASGEVAVTVIVDDGQSENNTFTREFNITVNQVNDPPTFKPGPNQEITDDYTTQTVPGWATDISPGPGNESDQAVEFHVTTDNDTLFADKPSVSADGRLAYTPAKDSDGTTLVTVVLKDDGGIENGGIDSFLQEFTVIVKREDDPPIVISPVPDIIVNEDSPSTIADLAHVFNDPDNNNSDMFKFVLSNNNPSLVSPVIDGNTLSLVYKPDQSGTAEIVIRGSSNGKSADDMFTVTVKPVDDPPVAIAPIPDVKADEDAPDAHMDITAVFTDTDNDDSAIGKSVLSNTNPLLVSASISGNILTLDYQENQSGEALITIRGTSGGLSADDAFKITVGGNDDPPVVSGPIPDVNTQEDSQNMLIDLVPVFTDIDNDDSGIGKSVLSNTNPLLVSADISNNTLTLDYQENQSGEAWITIRGTSGGLSADDKFKVTVDPVDDPPVILSSIPELNVYEDAVNTIIDLAPVFTDTDNDDAAIGKSVSSNTNSPLVSAVISENMLTLDYQDDQYGTAEITIIATSNKKTVSHTFNVIVEPVEDPIKLAVPITDVTADEDAANTLTDLTLVFTDADDDDSAITKTVQLNTNPSLVSAYVSENNTLILDYQENQNGTAWITVRGELEGQTADNTFKVTVNEVNDAPVLDNSGDMKLAPIGEDVPEPDNIGIRISRIIGTSMIADPVTDPDHDALEGIAVTEASNDNGTWQYRCDPDDDFADFPTDIAEDKAVLLNDTAVIRFMPNPDYNGLTDPGIKFRAWDRTSGKNGDTGTDTTTNGDTTAFSTEIETASIIVSPVNDQPSFTAGHLPTVDEDAGTQAVEKWISFSPGPPDEHDQVPTYTVGNIDNPDLFKKLPGVDPEGNLIYNPARDAWGSSAFTVSVQDSGGVENGGIDISDTRTFTITVNPVNDAPVVKKNKYYWLAEDTSLSIEAPGVLSSDKDADGDSLSALILTLPSHGDLHFNPDGAFEYTPYPNYHGGDTFTYRISDGKLSSENEAKVFLITNPVNDGPDTKSDKYKVNEDSILTVPALKGILANDTDPDGDPIKAIKITDTYHGKLEFNKDGSFTYTPDMNYNGLDRFTYKASDGDLNSRVTITSIMVNSVNDWPVITQDQPVTVEMDEEGWPTPFSLTLNATDIDKDRLFWSISKHPIYGTARTIGEVGNSKAIGYIPYGNYNGQDSFEVRVSDKNGGSDTIMVNVIINAMNDAPTIHEGDSVKVTMDKNGNPTPFSLTLHAFNFDEQDTLTWEISEDPGHGIAEADIHGESDGPYTVSVQIRYEPHISYIGEDSFEVSVSDDVYRDTIIVNVEIIAPILSGDIDNNGAVELKDAIIALKVLTGMKQDDIHIGADVDNDGNIGLKELIYILRIVSDVNK